MFCKEVLKLLSTTCYTDKPVRNFVMKSGVKLYHVKMFLNSQNIYLFFFLIISLTPILNTEHFSCKKIVKTTVSFISKNLFFTNINLHPLTLPNRLERFKILISHKGLSFPILRRNLRYLC